MITKQAKMTQSRPGVTEGFFNDLYSMLLNRATLRVDITIDLFKEEDSGRGLFIIKTEGIGGGEQIVI